MLVVRRKATKFSTTTTFGQLDFAYAQSPFGGCVVIKYSCSVASENFLSDRVEAAFLRLYAPKVWHTRLCKKMCANIDMQKIKECL